MINVQMMFTATTTWPQPVVAGESKADSAKRFPALPPPTLPSRRVHFGCLVVVVVVEEEKKKSCHAKPLRLHTVVTATGVAFDAAAG